MSEVAQSVVLDFLYPMTVVYQALKDGQSCITGNQKCLSYKYRRSLGTYFKVIKNNLNIELETFKIYYK